jgi:hypothetical protein
MKKALTILVAMLFLVVAVGVAYSAETTFTGQYKVRAWSNWNLDKKPGHINSERGLYTGYFDQRFRLTITHTRSEFLKAVVQFDLVEDTWGQQRNFRINDSITGEFIRHAYIEFTMPKIGTFTLGKQPITMAQGLVFSDTLGYLDGIKWANKWGPVGVSAMYIKMYDNVSAGAAVPDYNRDGNIWALDINITPNENHNIELFGGIFFSNNGSAYSHGIDGSLPAHYDDSRIGFLGLGYTGEFADMISVKAEISGIIGKELKSGDKIRGLNVYLDAAYHNDMLKVGLAFVLGSGQTNHKWNDGINNMNFIIADDFAFGEIIASGNGGRQDEYGYGLGFGDDIENLTAVKLYAEVKPMEKLTVTAAVIWAKWTEPVGNASAYGHPMEYYTVTNFSRPAWYAHSTDLGWEVDLGFSYEIMEGLTYNLATGVLFTGDSFDYVGTTGGHENWGPIWTINNNLTYEF